MNSEINSVNLKTGILYPKRRSVRWISSKSIFESKSLRDFTKHIEDRLHLVPRYLQKVTPCPFNIGHPTWEYAEDFDIRNHIFEIKSRKKLSNKDLVKLAGEKLSDVLDRNKPLWELYIVNNLEDGRRR